MEIEAKEIQEKRTLLHSIEKQMAAMSEEFALIEKQLEEDELSTEQRACLKGKLDTDGDKYSMLRKQQNSLEEALKMHDYFAFVIDFLSGSDNHRHMHIDSQTTTRGMMTNLRAGRMFVPKIAANGTILEERLEKRIDYYIINNAYILVYSGIEGMPLITGESITATAFKKREGGFYRKVEAVKNNETNRKVVLKTGDVVQLYERPIHLEAQTEYDMDYRKEWVYGELVYEGNNYGDTSTFYFVGEIVG